MGRTKSSNQKTRQSPSIPKLSAIRKYCKSATTPYFKRTVGASGEIRTLKHLFLRQAAIPIRARWHMVHRGGFEPPRPTWGDRVTAGPFRPGSRTCANLAEGRRIERPSLITTLWFSGPVADHSAVPSAMAESAGVEPASLLREPLFSRQVPCRPAHSPLNCQRTTEFW